MKFTDDQKKVIEIRGNNILVSAAAGSGKTAVIVERILQKLIRESGDITRMLIVTFTRAASQEMKERIRDALTEALKVTGDDPEAAAHLERQISAVPCAPIMTIDSFCLELARSHFQLCGIDPAFRVADEGELAMLKADVMDALLARHYEEDSSDSAFYDFLERFSLRRNDEDVSDAILQLYGFSVSRPDPQGYLRELPEGYRAENEEELEKTVFMKECLQIAGRYLCEAREVLEYAKETAAQPTGPDYYIPLFEAEIAQIEDVLKADSYPEMRSALQKAEFARLPVRRSDDFDPELKKKASDLRNNAKKTLGELRDGFFEKEPASILSELKDCLPSVQELSELALEFSEDYAEAKRKRGIADFSDLEHMALRILQDEEARQRCSSFYDEILVDEYQDSNRIQDMIFTLLSNGRNYFCVGDVKQSIYSFRDACPELFLQKYNLYGTVREAEEEEKELPGVKITLSKNFRSRKEVISSVNRLFSCIMKQDTGGVEYDEDAKLNYGELYQTENPESKTEYIRVLNGTEKEDREAEAQAVAQRIRELEGSFPVEDKTTGEVHPCRYGDIVILLRTLKDWDEIFMKALEENGIPAVMDSRSGYLLSFEIRTILNYLSVIDNPRQDIPLAGTLMGFFGGMSENDTALIRACNQEGDLYDALLSAASGENLPEQEEGTGRRAASFLEKLNQYREAAVYSSIRDLIARIIRDTRYDHYVRSMPGGERRLANLNMLLFRASQFEKISYRGLFRFIRYIENMKKFELDFGEANTESQENSVRIMSIHHSKGLEFPVVFLSGTRKAFNQMDLRSRLLLDDELGIGMDRTDPARRTRQKTLIKRVAAERKKEALIGEELRVFYVAMTRAREKLIMTCAEEEEKDIKLKSSVGDAGCIADWIEYAFDRDRELSEAIHREILTSEELLFAQLDDAAGRNEKRKEFLAKASSVSTERLEELRQMISFSYPYESSVKLPDKVSVSFLKHEAMEEAGVPLNANIREKDPTVPRFISGSTKDAGGPAPGALRGTAYHTAFENFPFGQLKTKEDVSKYLQRLEAENRLSAEAVDFIRPEDLLIFQEGRLATRMEEAQKKKKLYREQPFVIEVSAAEINAGYPAEERVMVQGIIDAYFEEEGELVVMDYKTDRVNEIGELVLRYRAQIEYYAKALELLTGMKVKEKILYSVPFHAEVSI